MRVTHRALSVLAIGMIGFGSTAQAQVNFFTTGYFTGTQSGACTPSVPMGASFASCATTNFSLQFFGNTYNNVEGGIDYGHFDLTANSNNAPLDFGPLGASPSDLMFHLVIHETGPTPATFETMGLIVGSIHVGPPGNTQSTLFWDPLPQTFDIGSAHYSFIFDNSGLAANAGYLIPLDQTHLGMGPGSSATFKGNVTTTPEPGTVALFATGLAGLLPIVIRRKRKSVQ